jgi:signal peptidase I
MTTLARLRKNALFETVFLVALALGLALCVQAYAVKPYRIPSPSMEPTLTIGQRVLVNRLSHRLGSSPHVGDIIVFHPPATANDTDPHCGRAGQGGGTAFPCSLPYGKEATDNFIKRVVAVGGDTIAIRNGHAVRNGVQAKEPFAAHCDPAGEQCTFARAITVPKGYVFVMGDNRGESDDSRFWGPVPVSWVVGDAIATYWPPSRIGGV